MDESEYSTRVSRTFAKLMNALDAADPDVLDVESTGDMITVTSHRGEKCVINTQRAVHQIWVAGKSQGIHFSWDAARQGWWDDKQKGIELFAFIGEAVREIGEGFELKA